jgi:hypothetical protein
VAPGYGVAWQAEGFLKMTLSTSWISSASPSSVTRPRDAVPAGWHQPRHAALLIGTVHLTASNFSVG